MQELRGTRGTTIGKRTLIVGICLLALLLVAFGRPPERASTANTLRILSASPPDYLDPGLSYQQVSWLMQINAYNGLLNYKKEAGPAGAELIPDLAEAIPEPTNGGKTYTFQMRKGIKWGPPLTREVLPSDIKWGMERLFLLPSPGVGFYSIIEGADAFQAKKAKTIEGIVTDDVARTITFTLTRPDATFLYTLALPFSYAVPKGTPAKDQSIAGFVPATGPYMFTEYEANRRIVLERNPNFKEWTEHTPTGKVDKMVIELGVNPENGITKIKRGDADYMLDAVPRSKLALLLGDESLKKQIHVENTATTYYIFMNTKLPPFDNVKVRQAVNYAIDRRAMVKLTGGQGSPSSTILPPTMPKFVDHKLYAEPDMAKAKALIAESGITPGKVDFWCRADEPYPTLAQYMQDTLGDLGFEVTVKCIDKSAFYTTVGNSETKARIGFGNWGQDFPEGSNFFDVLLNGKRITDEHNNNFAWYNGADEEIAATMKSLDQPARDQSWVDIDRETMENDAPWAPYMHYTWYHFTSARVKDPIVNPVYGMLFINMDVGGGGEAGGDE